MSLLRRGIDRVADRVDRVADRVDRRQKAARDDAGHHLLPTSTASATVPRRPSHQVRVQGRLVLVRSVSAANLRTPPPSTPPPPLPLPLPTAEPLSSHARAVSHSTTQQPARPAAPAARPRMSLDEQAARDRRGEQKNAEPAEPTETDRRETALRDRQKRGYGIGGAGNIRRPTEVMTFPSSKQAADAGPGMGSGSRNEERRGWNLIRRLGFSKGSRKKVEAS